MTQKKKILKKVLCFNYIDTPSTGIYINENIMGILSYLVEISGKNKTSSVPYEIPEQNKEYLSSTNQIKLATGLCFKCGQDFDTTRNRITDGTKNDIINETKNNIIKELFNGDNSFKEALFVRFQNDIQVVENSINNVSTTSAPVDFSYQQNRLFNKKKPLIQDILGSYISSKEPSYLKLCKKNNYVTISDFKILYLFANYGGAKDDQNQKCEQQIKLLEDTKKFINFMVI